MKNLKEKVIVYIDGFNLYFGIKEKGWNDTLWLNVKGFANSLIKENQVLLETKYFTSRVRNNPPKEKRQGTYLEALETLSGVSIYYGHYQSKTEQCRKCGHTYPYSSEKMTDVNIATELLCDAYQNKYDVAVIVSGDSDLVPPINAVIKNFPEKKVIIAFPPERFNNNMKIVSSGSLFINRIKLKSNSFPDIVVKADGFNLVKPITWR
jgi:uncharacterized LabA/DUF88 family protein